MSLESAVQTGGILCCVSLAVALLPGIYSGELFPWHPLMMTVGFLGFMCEGLLAAYRFRSTDGHPRMLAITNHMYIQLAATASILLGFLAIYVNKARHGKPHFTTLHGKLGVIEMLLVAAAPTLGFLSFRRLGLLTRLSAEVQPRVKWAHRLLGAITWALALVTMQLDLPHAAALQGVWCRLWQVASLCVGVGMLAVLRQLAPGKALLPEQVNFTFVPQGAKLH